MYSGRYNSKCAPSPATEPQRRTADKCESSEMKKKIYSRETLLSLRDKPESRVAPSFNDPDVYAEGLGTMLQFVEQAAGGKGGERASAGPGNTRSRYVRLCTWLQLRYTWPRGVD